MKIAITGIIGSGKSEVSKILKENGEYVLSADGINRELLNSADYLKKLNNLFPSAFFDKTLDKGKLTQIVFGDEKELEKLNSLAHPEILKIIKERSEGKEFVFCEVPLLSQEWAKEFDKVWLVQSEDSQRIKRICERDGRSESEAWKILNSQNEYKNITYKNCDIIVNNGNLEELKQAVERLYCKALEKNI